MNKLKSKNEFADESNPSKQDNELELNSEELAKKVIEFALEQKSLDTVGFDVTKVSNIANFIVIASGTSSRHVKGIADKIESNLVKYNQHPIRTDGYDEGEWIVMDFGDVIVHLFYEPKRQYYELDALMNSAEKLVLNEELTSQIRNLKTGMHSL